MAMSHYLHHVPGRLRVKTQTLKNGGERAIEARQLLEDLAGVEAIELNQVTGSMLVRYDEARVTSSQILGLLVAKDVINLLPKPQRPGLRDRAPSDRRGQIVEHVTDSLTKFLTDFIVEKVLQRAAVALIGAIV
jgi:hypothetical protein